MGFINKIMVVLFAFFSLLSHAGVQANTQEMKTGFFQINGVQHCYKKLGTGTPILVLHGGPGMFHDYFLPHMELLAEDFQLIFYDQRGNGCSPAELSSENFTIEQLVEDLEQVRVTLGLEQMNVLGHSWGGLLAMHYAVKYPNNLNKLILTNPAAADSKHHMQMLQTKNKRYTPEVVKEIGQIMQSGAIQKGDVKAFMRLIALAEGVNAYNPAEIETLLGDIQYSQQKMANALMISQLKNAFFENYDLHPQLAKVGTETLVIHGDADTIPLSSDQAIVQSLPNARLVRFDKSGHYPYAEQPHRFRQVVQGFMFPGKS